MNGSSEYLEAKVMTASPEQLHLMVLDGAIRNASRGQEALEAGDIEAAHFALNDARGCVGELISGVDHQQNPELAANLNGLFVFVYRKLVDADRNHDPALVGDAVKILRMHRDTWLQLIQKLSDAGEADAGPDAPRVPNTPHVDPADFDSPRHSWTT